MSLECYQLLMLCYNTWGKLGICFLIHCWNLKFNLSVIHLLMHYIFPNQLPKLIGPLGVQDFPIISPFLQTQILSTLPVFKNLFHLPFLFPTAPYSGQETENTCGLFSFSLYSLQIPPIFENSTHYSFIFMRIKIFISNRFFYSLLLLLNSFI